MMSSPPSSYSQAFELLHPEIKRWIWDSKWESLHDVQERAIPAILSASKDVLICAPTASGKTESCQYPIFTRLAGLPESERLVIQISPLKALINDQAIRLELLADRMGIRVYPWHGDISAQRKKAFHKNPTGILLITPESLEAMFVNRGSDVPRLFAALQYIIVDELHSFISTERGRQLLSIMHRIELAIGRQVPRIGLSATLGDVDVAAKFLRSTRPVEIINSKPGGGNIKISLRTYFEQTINVSDGAAFELDDNLVANEVDQENEINEETELISDLVRHVYDKTRNSKNLIFPNSRKDVENYTVMLSKLCEIDGIPSRYFPHHGNLSKELRENIESMLKDPNLPVSVLCTSTMEMGVDFGSVKSIAQIGVPPSVASLRQRLGRSGRKQGESPILWAYIIAHRVTDKTPLVMHLHPSLVQTIATIQLLIRGEYEPPNPKYMHLSTLVHQILSCIAQHSSRSAMQLWDDLIESKVHAGLSKSDFKELLLSLGKNELISQDSDGSFLLGKVGEVQVNNFEFYSVFPLTEEYRIECNGKVIGTLSKEIPIICGQKIVFAGQRWKVIEVSHDAGVVRVERAKGGRATRFGGEGALVHSYVAKEMREVLCCEEDYPYLDAISKTILGEARIDFRNYNLTESAFLQDGKNAIWFHWDGDVLSRTLTLILQSMGIESSSMCTFVEVKDITQEKLKELLTDVYKKNDWDELLLDLEIPLINRWDWALPKHLRNKDFLARACDFKALKNAIKRDVDVGAD